MLLVPRCPRFAQPALPASRGWDAQDVVSAVSFPDTLVKCAQCGHAFRVDHDTEWHSR